MSYAASKTIDIYSITVIDTGPLQSGNSEALAAKFSKQASDYGLVGTVYDMDGYDFASLSSMKRVLIVCMRYIYHSTCDEGIMKFLIKEPVSNTHLKLTTTA